jgi:2,3-diketo-5-methylthio-1-phosphopentane phosphatase/HAD superfamily hydrolase (TIGR01509 family)
MTNPLRTLVICDFDGTVSKKDVGYNLLSHFSGGRWDEIDQDFVAGRIGSREAYQRMITRLQGIEADYQRVARELGEMDPDFAAFVQFCQERGMAVKIASDGFGLYIRLFLEELGIRGVEYFANEICFGPGGKMTADFPFASADCPDCGCCKQELVRGYRDRFDRIVYIGDGISDRCAALEADLVFAKRSLYHHCLAQGLRAFSFRGFSDILQVFQFRLRGVIFDLDGTLIDSFEPIFRSFRHAFQILGYDLQLLEGKRNVVGSTLEESLSQLVDPKDVSRAVQIFREHYRRTFAEGTRILPGVEETLETLAGLELQLAVATNKNGPLSREILEHLGLKKYFREIVGAGEGFASKPAPEILTGIAGRLGLPPGELAYLGDSPLDISAGRAAGMKTVGVPTGYYSALELGEEKPTLFCPSLREFIPVARILQDGIAGGKGQSA